ncbi:hypothetical protein G6045_28175 [Streptomyces sp. YC504]|uniref:DUF2530 domain-containing protein n=1 Tax=Streptomyces mesophilus TaxID=1775132 RepID=A0A6G4XSB9_9ACTN|nr:hypothetical protein [Streptomyces mesophilus]NGO79501.1 hypothetical protein [Streptomyces mesophilus]
MDHVKHRPPTTSESVMKPLLWLLLVVALIVNVSTSFLWEGLTQVAVSIPTGVLFLGSAVGLWLLRDKQQA